MDSTKPDSENNFLVALDRSGNEYGLAYMDLVTGEFQVTTPMTLAWFVEKSAIYVRVRWSWLCALPEQEERVFVSQMNLLLSHVETALDDVQLFRGSSEWSSKRKRLENFSSMSTRHKCGN